jgi:short-subunit dehydrogenase
MLKAAQGSTPFVIPPDQAADDIWKAIRKRKQLIYTPARWRLIMLGIQHTPSFLFRKLSL